MPIHVNELIIRTVVTTAGAEPRAAADDGRELLVAECVEQVLEILREKGER